VLFAAAYWCFDLAVLRGGVPHPLDDLWEYALVARHLLEDGRWHTSMIYPPLWPLRDTATMTVPVLVHGPLLPVVLAGLLAVAPPSAVDAFAWFGAACATLATIPLLRLGSRAFGAPVGVAAALIFTLAPLTLQAVHHSASVVAAALLLLIALEAAERERPRPILAAWAAAATWLLRPELLVVVPILAWRIARPLGDPPSRESNRWRRAAVFLAAFAAGAAPWWWHCAAAGGSPLFNLSAYSAIGYWGGRPGHSVLQDFSLPPSLWTAMLAAALPTLWTKWLAFLPRALKHALFAPGGGVGALMVPGLAAAFGAPGSRPAVAAAAAIALMPVATMTVFFHQMLYVMPVLGLYAVAAALGARWLAGLLPARARGPRVWIGGLVLLALPATVAALRTGAEEGERARRLIADERAALAATAAPDRTRRVLFTDRAGFASWTTGRPSIWISAQGFLSLYRDGGAEASRRGLPAAPDALDGWFHAGHWAPGEPLKVRPTPGR